MSGPQKRRYVFRFTKADGRPRAITVWAFNKSDADAMARREAGDELRGAVIYGLERG